MTALPNHRRLKTLGIPFGLAGAVAVALAASTGMSVTVGAKPSADSSTEEAQKALKQGKVDKAIELSEALVAQSPREPSYRTLLGHAYLRAGRFEAAATTFDDAMKLGDNSSRTALALALSLIAGGHNREAVAVIDDWRDAIPAADRGLALALAGDSGHGVAVLADSLRQGDNTTKTRQNLAYAYALDGRWREARVMVEQDVPANLVDERISEWAARARPEDQRLRVAKLLGVPMRSDPGQPTALALSNSPIQEQLAAEKVEAKGATPADDSSASLAQYRPVGAASDNADPAPAPALASGPTVQPLPASYNQQQPQTASVGHRAGVRPRQSGTGYAGSHRVQLGAFSSQQGARRAWGIYAARNPELKNYRMTITEVTLDGRHLWRVAAGGLNAKRASGLCSTVKGRGGECFAYSVTSMSTRSTGLAKAEPAAKPAVKLGAKQPAAKPGAKATPKELAAAASPSGPAEARRH